MRPDTLNFPHVRAEFRTTFTGSARATRPDVDGNQEWTFPHVQPQGPPRPIHPGLTGSSFYVFDAQGGLGVGSYVQVPVHGKGRWIHLVGVVDLARTLLLQEQANSSACDTYRGPAQGGCEIHFQPPPNQNLQLAIDPSGRIRSSPAREQGSRQLSRGRP